MLIFSFAVTEEEKDLIARGKYDALIEQQRRTDAAIEEEVWLILHFSRFQTNLIT